MKKVCPDLSAMSDDELRNFWHHHRPEQLKRLGDRLLAESLPRMETRVCEFYVQDLAALRQSAGLTVTQAAQLLHISSVVILAWESGDVRPPASLSLIYTKALV